MKKTILSTVSLALVLLTGCVALSVYPYYTTRDLIFDPALVGVWAEPADTDANSETWTFEKINAQAYQLTIGDKDKETKFEARLFKLKSYTFLDCLPTDGCDYSSPCHVLLRVDSIQPTLGMRPIDAEWLTDLIGKNPKAIRHSINTRANEKGNDSKDFVLTADTAELQKFILKHIKNEDAWGKPIEMEKR